MGRGNPSWKCQRLLWPVSHGNLFRLPRIEQAVFSVCRPEINTTLHLLPQPSPQVIFIILHCGCSFFKTRKTKMLACACKSRASDRKSSHWEGRVPRRGRPHFQMQVPGDGGLSLTLRKSTGPKEFVYILLSHRGLGTFLIAWDSASHRPRLPSRSFVGASYGFAPGNETVGKPSLPL